MLALPEISSTDMSQSQDWMKIKSTNQLQLRKYNSSCQKNKENIIRIIQGINYEMEFLK